MRQANFTVVLAIVFGSVGCNRTESDAVQGYVEGEYVYVAAPYSGALETLSVQRGVRSMRTILCSRWRRLRRNRFAMRPTAALFRLAREPGGLEEGPPADRTGVARSAAPAGPCGARVLGERTEPDGKRPTYRRWLHRRHGAHPLEAKSGSRKDRAVRSRPEDCPTSGRATIRSRPRKRT